MEGSKFALKNNDSEAGILVLFKIFVWYTAIYHNR